MRFILLVLWLLLALWEPVAARTIRVSEKESEHGELALYMALLEAAPHDTLLVAAGYYEGVGIDKPLTLIGAGADSTIVAGHGGSGFGIGAEGVTIEGFYIQSNFDKCRGARAIVCNNCSATLKHNILEGCYSAITTDGNARPLSAGSRPCGQRRDRVGLLYGSDRTGHHVARHGVCRRRCDDCSGSDADLGSQHAGSLSALPRCDPRRLRHHPCGTDRRRATACSSRRHRLWFSGCGFVGSGLVWPRRRAGRASRHVQRCDSRWAALRVC